MIQPLHITLLQMDLVWEDPEANRNHVEAMLGLQNQPTDIIVLPEMFSTGFTMKPEANAEIMDGPTSFWMRNLAAQQSALVMGSLVIEENGKYFNRFLAVGPEGLVASYDKRHCFRMAGEHKHYQPGTNRVVFTYKGWRICPQVCYDLRFPVWSRTRSGPEGPDYDLLVYVANWPKMRVSHWETLLAARAIENQAFVIGVNRVGEDGNGVPYSGSTMALDHMGSRLIYNSGEEQVLRTTLEPEAMVRWRQKFPVWMDADLLAE